MSKSYTIEIAGLKRDLPLCKVSDDFYIGAFIMFGMMAWVILKLVTGKAKDISGVMWVSVALFAIYIVLKVMGLA